MPSPDHPDRPLLTFGIVGLVVAVALFAGRLGAVTNVIGIVLAVIAAYVILKSLGWSHTDKR